MELSIYGGCILEWPENKFKPIFTFIRANLIDGDIFQSTTIWTESKRKLSRVSIIIEKLSWIHVSKLDINFLSKLNF